MLWGGSFEPYGGVYEAEDRADLAGERLVQMQEIAGITTVRGGEWTAVQVQRVLSRDRVTAAQYEW